ncbi:hypothetical protein JTB14_008471 [Gonioctena quinquepunctata]|nr:hypothetical protein JTB14_008471 [Gonioctena quinquepunctata]
MTTTVAETEGIQVVSTTTAAMASVSTTIIGAGNIMSTAAGGMAGSNSSTYSGGNATSAGSSLSAVEEMNFYLRRLTLGGTSDVARIDSFGEGLDYEMFLKAVQSVGTHHGWTEAQIMRTVEMKLKDKAREYYGALLPIEKPSSMDQMENWFRSVFGRRLTMSAGKRELERCIRNPDETLGEFAQRLKVIANKMFPPSSVNTPAQTYHRDILLVNQFMDGIEGRLANEVSRSGEFYSLDECLQEAEQCEEVVPGWYMRPATMHEYPQYGEWRPERRYPIVEKGGMEPWKTALRQGITNGTNGEEEGIPKEAPEIMERIDSPTCEPAVYVAVKKGIER